MPPIKKIIQCEYPDDAMSAVEKFLREQLINEDGSMKIYEPYIIIEIIKP